MRHSRPLTTGLFGLACLLLAFVPDAWQQRLAFDRQAILAGELWRLWSGHLVHFSMQHAAADTAVLLILGMVAESKWGSSWMARALCGSALFISLTLLLIAPALLEYRGASALAVAIAVRVGMHYRKTRPDLRAYLNCLGGFFALKMIFDASGAQLDLGGLPDGISVCWQAHALGALAGFALAQALPQSNSKMPTLNQTAA